MLGRKYTEYINMAYIWILASLSGLWPHAAEQKRKGREPTWLRRPSWKVLEGIRFEPRRLVSRCLVAVSMFTGSANCWKPGFTALYCSAGTGTPARPAQLTCQPANQAHSTLFYYAKLFILQFKKIFPGLLYVWLFFPLFINGTRAHFPLLPSFFFLWA